MLSYTSLLLFVCVCLYSLLKKNTHTLIVEIFRNFQKEKSVNILFIIHPNSNTVNLFHVFPSFFFFLHRIMSVAGRITASQRRSNARSQDLWICYHTWQKGLCRCEEGLWDRELVLAYLGGLDIIARILTRGAGEAGGPCERKWCENGSRRGVVQTSRRQWMCTTFSSCKREGLEFWTLSFRTIRK